MNQKNKRIIISLIAGALLGIFCIVGVGTRIGYSGNEWYLFGMWYNRVIMGLLIGFAGSWKILEKHHNNALIRGLILGTVVSLAISFTTGFADLPSLAAGIFYGIIIDVVATHLTEE